jgi:very-short-patch-repair endonuclease
MHNKILLMNKTEEFITQSREKHGDKYDYSKTIYKNNLEEVIIICKDHGDFLQLPKTHKKGNGCHECAMTTRKEKRTMTTEQFIEKAISVHGNKYCYSNVIYKKSREYVIIICRVHGEFEQTPNCHLDGKGCVKCSTKINADKQRKTKEQFIQDAIHIHGDKYDYSKVEYENASSKVIIICEHHSEFEQTPNGHLDGKGCIKCAGCYKSNTVEFIEKAQLIHGDKYVYSKVDYNTVIEKVIIICKIHCEFEQTPDSHLRGVGCPFCVNKTEGILFEKIQPVYTTLITQFKRDFCKKRSYLPFDFCIPELKIIIELDGPQHFIQVSNWSMPEEQFENDVYKQRCANDNGYSVIRLLQKDVFNDNYDWVNKLCETIENLKKCGVDKVKNVYLCKNNEYDNIKSAFEN